MKLNQSYQGESLLRKEISVQSERIGTIVESFSKTFGIFPN